jgi:hypothetical protein
MGRASRSKRERPRWTRSPEAAVAVQRAVLFEQDLAERSPGIWEKLDRVRAERRTNPAMPRWCLVPGLDVYALTGDYEWAHATAALYAWRQGRSIYRVDPDLAQELAETTLPDEIPASKLLELPEWGLYLTGVIPASGAFVHLDWSSELDRPELWLTLDIGIGQLRTLTPLPVFLDNPSLSGALADACEAIQPPKDVDRQLTADMEKIGIPTDGPQPSDLDAMLTVLRPLVATLLYLCSTEPDVVDPDRPLVRPHRAAHAAEEPRVFELGFRVGRALRAARREDEQSLDGHHRAPVAHLRRAHWHHYWVGPRTADDDDQRARHLELRWITPVLVGSGETTTVLRELPDVHGSDDQSEARGPGSIAKLTSSNDL